MHRNVEQLLGRLATDPKLRRRFAANPERVLRELVGAGLELTEIELAALAATRPESLHAFAATLDARLRRAAHAGESHRTEDDPSTTPETPR
jgi:hypothetical protein